MSQTMDVDSPAQPPPANDADDRSRQLETAFTAGLGVPFTAGNRVTPLRNGVEIFPAMLEAIAAAQHTIDFLTFVYWTGEIAERFATALVERARAGVRVQIILDAIGAGPMPDELVDRLEAAGCVLIWFRPPMRWKIWQSDNRTHRKVLVCDSRVAFTGGVGIAREWEGDVRSPEEWRETHFRIQGPAVPCLQGAFVDEWAEAGHRLSNYDDTWMRTEQDCGPSLIQTLKTTATVKWSDIATLLQLVVLSAREHIRVTTPYFVPGDILVDALRTARARGVRIELLLPGPHMDKRMAQLAGNRRFAELLDAGVEIHEYQRSMVHAKLITVDGILSVIGSANWDQRSMSKDDELALVVLDAELASTLDRHYTEDVAEAREIDLDRWRKRSVFSRIKERLTGAARPQL